MKKLLCNILYGTLFALAYPSALSQSLGPIFAITALFFFFYNQSQINSLKLKLKYFILFSSPIVLFGFYWIQHTMQEFAHLPLPIAIFVNILYIPICLIYYWPSLASIHFIERKIPHIKSLEYYPLIQAIIFSLFEIYTPQQFPLMLGHSWLILSPYLELASIFSVSIFSFISYLFIFEAIHYIKYKKINLISIFIFFSLSTFSILSPIIIPQQISSINTRIVQANIENDLKVSSENSVARSAHNVFNRLKKLSLKKAEIRPELIIWPETAFPKTVYPQADQAAPLDFQELISKSQAQFIVGGYSRHDSNFRGFEDVFNSTLHFTNDFKIAGIYNKKLLIPFGETLPLPRSINKIASDYLPTMAFFARGTSRNSLKVKENFNLISPICYEILQSRYIRDLLNANDNNVQGIVNLTNDSWYGHTIEPEQHLFQAKWRAIEFHLPIIRSTNTGISSYILPNGQEASRLPINKADILDYPFPIYKEKPTIYQQYGLLPLFSLWALLFLLMEIKRRIPKR